MNYRVPGWNMENDFLPVANQKKSMGPDHELVELLWRNGQVVLHSQTNRKQGPVNGPRQVQKPDQPILKGGSFGSPSNLIQEDVTESWIQYPLEESMEKEFCSEFFYELPPSDPIEIDKHMKQFKEDNDFKLNSSEEAIFRAKNSLASSHKPLSKQLRIIEGEIGETSVMTIGSSHCGSNQVPNEVDLGRFSSNVFGTIGISAGPLMEDSKNVVSHSERRQTDMVEMTVTSSSGGSGASIGRTGKQSISTHNHKRKGREVEDFECQSEDPDFESAQTSKSAQRSRKNRAAEVHNLSERKRRDRINEKMRALRELIPHCNKTDKASMLDEAIEYLKSLQLQVQLMWMGSGMAPMMFPSVQHYMTRMGPSPLPSIHNPMQLQRMPILDQGISASSTPGMCQTQLLNPVNFQHQMQNPNIAEQYAHYMGFHPMQPAPQPTNMFGYASQTIQQNHKTTSPSTTGGPLNGGAPNVNTSTGKMG